MRLTERARPVDKDHEDAVTNELPEHTLYVLRLMALALPMRKRRMSFMGNKD